MVLVVTAWMASRRWMIRGWSSLGSVTLVLSGGVLRDVHGFDNFFVEFEPFAVTRGGLLDGAIDDGGDAVEGDGAALEVIAVNGAENVFGGDEGERVGLGGR